MDFGIPTIKIFLNKNDFGVEYALYKFCTISTLTYGTSRWVNQFIGSMNECSVSKKPNFICKHLILSKISCFEVEASWWGCFKGVYSLSGFHLARNVDDLLDDVTGLVGFCFVPESDDSSDDVSCESYEDNEDKE